MCWTIVSSTFLRSGHHTRITKVQGGSFYPHGDDTGSQTWTGVRGRGSYKKTPDRRRYDQLQRTDTPVPPGVPLCKGWTGGSSVEFPESKNHRHKNTGERLIGHPPNPVFGNNPHTRVPGESSGGGTEPVNIQSWSPERFPT